MGDRFVTTHTSHGLQTQAALPAPVNPKPYLAADVPLSVGVGGAGPHLTQCVLGRGSPPYQVASIQPFGHKKTMLQTDPACVRKPRNVFGD